MKEKKVNKPIIYVTFIVILLILMLGSLGIGAWALFETKMEVGGSVEYIAKYDVTFYNTDGSKVLDSKKIEYNDNLSYTGETSYEDEYGVTYSISGWQDESGNAVTLPTPVQQEMKLYAQYNETAYKYDYINLQANSNGTYTCNGFEVGKEQAHLVIPENYKGLGPVTSIAVAGFNGCKNLVSVSIPSTVTAIGDMTFYNCTSLESLVLSEGLQSIGNSAFNNCSNLKSIIFPSTLKTIESNAFANCNSLTSIIIPNSVESIGDNAFNNCTSLKLIDFQKTSGEITIWGFGNITATVKFNGATWSNGDAPDNYSDDNPPSSLHDLEGWLWTVTK